MCYYVLIIKSGIIMNINSSHWIKLPNIQPLIQELLENKNEINHLRDLAVGNMSVILGFNSPYHYNKSIVAIPTTTENQFIQYLELLTKTNNVKAENVFKVLDAMIGGIQASLNNGISPITPISNNDEDHQISNNSQLICDACSKGRLVMRLVATNNASEPKFRNKYLIIGVDNPNNTNVPFMTLIELEFNYISQMKDVYTILYSPNLKLANMDEVYHDCEQLNIRLCGVSALSGVGFNHKTQTAISPCTSPFSIEDFVRMKSHEDTGYTSFKSIFEELETLSSSNANQMVGKILEHANRSHLVEDWHSLVEGGCIKSITANVSDLKNLYYYDYVAKLENTQFVKNSRFTIVINAELDPLKWICYVLHKNNLLTDDDLQSPSVLQMIKVNRVKPLKTEFHIKFTYDNRRIKVSNNGYDMPLNIDTFLSPHDESDCYHDFMSSWSSCHELLTHKIRSSNMSLHEVTQFVREWNSSSLYIGNDMRYKIDIFDSENTEWQNPISYINFQRDWKLPKIEQTNYQFNEQSNGILFDIASIKDETVRKQYRQTYYQAMMDDWFRNQ